MAPVRHYRREPAKAQEEKFFAHATAPDLAGP
jgi:hypothetical protein